MNFPVSSNIGINYEHALNPQQLEAVLAAPSPLLVIAGAGSGKTRTLTYRVARLIEQGALPEEILLVTFTNKAAREMLARVQTLIQVDAGQLWGGTFHHIGHKLLRRHADAVGLFSNFTILDREEAAHLATETLRALGVNSKDKTAPKGDLLVEIFGLAAGRQLPVSETVQKYFPHLIEIIDLIERAGRGYANRKKVNGQVDFDDLLLLSWRLLHENEGLRLRYQRQFRHVLVDEYQDTNSLQAALVDLLAAEHRSLTAVGDDAQCIYSWRGADFRNIRTFPERYTDAKIIRIETNYRSTPEILALANHVIEGNISQFQKNLHSARPSGRNPKPALVILPDGNTQAAFIAKRILELQNEEAIAPEEIAVLYRSHFHAMELQIELARHNVPFDITSGVRFFEQAHIRDIAAFLRLTANPQDEMAFRRIALLLPGVGERTAEKWWRIFSDMNSSNTAIKAPANASESWKQCTQLLEQLKAPRLENKPAEQIECILKMWYDDYLKTTFPNYESRKEDLGQLAVFAETFDSTQEFLAQIALLTNTDTNEQNKTTSARIRLSTIHQAKGLEWKVVFIVMLCEGLFPSSRSIENPESLEEERRLFYVAITRARDELYLSYPAVRTTGDRGSWWQEPSRFVLGLPKTLVNPFKIARLGA